MSLPAFSVSKPVLVNLLVLLVLIAGVFAYRNMPKDQFPDVSIETVMVSTPLSGASPKEIEQLLTIPLEEEIAKVDEIDQMSSLSAEGISTIVVEFDAGVEDIFEKITEIQNQIEKVERFPDEAENPTVQEMKVSWDTITIAVLGSAPEVEVKEFVEDLETELETLPGVEEVRVAGLREREVWVEVDPHRLYSYGLSLNDVAQALRRRNLNLPGGLIRMGRGEFSVRTEAEFESVGQIGDTILLEDESGYVYIKDVATVADTFEDRLSLARLDGEPSVHLMVKKSEDSNAIKVVERVRETLERIESRLPAGTYLKTVDDTSIEIKQRLRSLYNNLLLGLVLVAASFTFFIGWRPALMVCLGIPVAFLATFILIDAYGYSVNMMVLFGLILVVGLVVDDAIVVSENVYRLAEAGMPLRQAAVKGAEEITWPVIATVMTTVAAFLPLLLMEGVLGRFMSIIPVVVTLALLASLVEAFAVLPAHIAEWGGVVRSRANGHDEPRPWLAALLARYERVLSYFLRHRYLTVLAVVVVAALTLNVAYAHMDFILFGGRDLESFAVTVEAPPGASLDETTRILRELEGQALTVARDSTEIEHLRTEVGSVQRNRASRVRATNVGELSIELVGPNDRERLGTEVKDEIRQVIQDVTGVRTMTFEDTRRGPPVGKPIMVRIKGDSFDVLSRIAAEVKEHLRGMDGVKDISDSFPPGKDEVRPVLDLEKVAALGLDVRTVAMEIRGAFDGLEATQIYDGNEEVEVMVKHDRRNRTSLASLRDMQFASPAGMVPFRNIGSMERRQGFAQIAHHDQKRNIDVLADVVEGETTSRRVNEELITHFADVGDRYPGYSLEFGGEWEDTQESLASMLRAFSITVILIYVILGGLFQSFVQPLVVMFSVPFSFIGVVVGFFVLDQPLGMFALIGVIALAGIVVNDSLILIDFINRGRRRGLAQRQSILQAGRARLRPIALTSVTTILGLSPMALGLFGVDQFLKPMAMAMAWGLSFATLLTLIVIPCIYSIFDDLSMLLVRRPLAVRRPRDPGEEFGEERGKERGKEKKGGDEGMGDEGALTPQGASLGS